MIEKVEYPKFHTFTEGVQFLQQGEWIDYEVKISGHSGALLTRENWLEAVADHSFMNDDGMGNEIDEHGNILGVTPSKWEGEPKKSKLIEVGDPGWIYPSQAARIRPETKYILWYNK